MGSALAQTEELDHEDAVVSANLMGLEVAVDVGSEAVFGLWG